MSNFLKLWTELKVPLLAIINILCAYFCNTELTELILGITNGVFLIIDAVLQYIAKRQGYVFSLEKKKK